jgi:hypothetical protein
MSKKTVSEQEALRARVAFIDAVALAANAVKPTRTISDERAMDVLDEVLGGALTKGAWRASKGHVTRLRRLLWLLDTYVSTYAGVVDRDEHIFAFATSALLAYSEYAP